MTEKDKVKQVTRERDENGYWQSDKPFRIDRPFGPTGYQDFSYLSDEEKALGIEMMKANAQGQTIQWGFGTPQGLPDQERLWREQAIFCLLGDPELMALHMDFFKRLGQLVTGLDSDELMAATTSRGGLDVIEKGKDPDTRRRLANAMLMILAVGTELNEPYFLRMFALTPTQHKKSDEKGSYLISAEKALMLRHPESSVWTAEECLVLQFTYAYMRREMTDGLYDRAEATWGKKETLRFTYWIAEYYWMVTFQAMYNRRKW
ncbi:MAG: hypothetical protein HKP58_10675 [Desulfatitalea sp.]|nr:hypothetical protein [Desulfatitalea sp.]NNK00864.1 hypothetical protein [Desulfatitalea sp.]